MANDVTSDFVLHKAVRVIYYNATNVANNSNKLPTRSVSIFNVKTLNAHSSKHVGFTVSWHASSGYRMRPLHDSRGPL